MNKTLNECTATSKVYLQSRYWLFRIGNTKFIKIGLIANTEGIYFSGYESSLFKNEDVHIDVGKRRGFESSDAELFLKRWKDTKGKGLTFLQVSSIDKEIKELCEKYPYLECVHLNDLSVNDVFKGTELRQMYEQDPKYGLQ